MWLKRAMVLLRSTLPIISLRLFLSIKLNIKDIHRTLFMEDNVPHLILILSILALIVAEATQISEAEVAVISSFAEITIIISLMAIEPLLKTTISLQV